MWIEWPTLYLRHGDVISIHEGCNRHDEYSLTNMFYTAFYDPTMVQTCFWTVSTKNMKKFTVVMKVR